MLSLRTVFLVWFALPLCSQSLQIQAGSVARLQEGTAVIRLDSPPGKEPVALQWEIHFPLYIQLDTGNAAAAEAAHAAGKSVACAMLVNLKGDIARCRCLLAGGVKLIGNGPIAILKYIPTRAARPGRYQLNLRNGLSVSEGTKKLPIKDAAVTIIVSP